MKTRARLEVVAHSYALHRVPIAHCHFPKSRTFALGDIFQPLNLIGRCHFLQSRYIFSRNILHIHQFSLFPRSSTIFVKYLMASNLPSGVIVQLSFIRILLITYLVERTKMILRHGSCTTSSACFKQIAWNAEYYYYNWYWLFKVTWNSKSSIYFENTQKKVSLKRWTSTTHVHITGNQSPSYIF